MIGAESGPNERILPGSAFFFSESAAGPTRVRHGDGVSDPGKDDTIRSMGPLVPLLFTHRMPPKISDMYRIDRAD